LVEIIANLRARIQEAKLNGWPGEVTGLETSLNEAVRKLVSLDRTKDMASGPVNLGIPMLGQRGRCPSLRRLDHRCGHRLRVLGSPSATGRWFAPA
jgi:hypothetical protein